MLYIKDMTEEGQRVKDVYLCKSIESRQAKNGSEYWNVILQDRTGTIDGKVWKPGDAAIDNNIQPMDYVLVTGTFLFYNNSPQLRIDAMRAAGEGTYEEGDYVPTSDKDNDAMFRELLAMVDSVKAPYYHELLEGIFHDETLSRRFRKSSAAKSIHHAFVGGLLEHTLGVAKLCDFFCTQYPYLHRDLLITAALCHDIGKIAELSEFPENDYTDSGQLIGHITMGTFMLMQRMETIPNFPRIKKNELMHCILAHHGELEFGSPKKPAIPEALALSLADNADAKMESMKEAIAEEADQSGNTWGKWNRIFDGRIRCSSPENQE